MEYIKAKNIRILAHQNFKQISLAALRAIDKKVEALVKKSAEYNGHYKRIDPEVVNIIKI